MIDFNFDLNEIVDEGFGAYTPINDRVDIFLRKIYIEFLDKGCTSEDFLRLFVVDVINHEILHRAIDPCLEDPNEHDEHKIYKYLVN